MRNLGKDSAHKLGGTLSTSVSALRPPFTALSPISKERSLMILTFCSWPLPLGAKLSGWGSDVVSCRFFYHEASFSTHAFSDFFPDQG